MNIIYQSINSGYKLEEIFLLICISTFLALKTITSKSPIVSVLCLISLFVTISSYLILLDMLFIALSYLLVYVGAISMLFIFILMLINVRISELLTEERNSAVLAALVILTFSLVFYDKLFYFLDIYAYLFNRTSDIFTYDENIIYSYSIDWFAFYNITANYISFVNSCVWDSHMIEISHITGIGNILYTTLFAHMSLIVNILLVAMVGAIIITIKPFNKLNESIENTSNYPKYVGISPYNPFNSVSKGLKSNVVL